MNKTITTLLLLSSVSAYASDAADKSVNADAELGVLITSGNTDSTSVKAKLSIQQELTKWRNKYVLEALFKEDTVENTTDGVVTKGDQVTAEKYFASLQSDYKLDEEHKGLFIYGSLEKDKFSGYQYQGTIAAGFSDRLFKNDNSFLDYSVGPGMAFSKADDSADGTSGASEKSGIVRLSGFYQLDISETSKFTQSLSSDVAVEPDKNTKSKSETALTTKINEDLSLKASLTITHNTEAAEGFDNADSQAAVTLVYGF